MYGETLYITYIKFVVDVNKGNRVEILTSSYKNSTPLIITLIIDFVVYLGKDTWKVYDLWEDRKSI